VDGLAAWARFMEVPAKYGVQCEPASSGETDPPAFNNDRPATLVETIPAGVDGEGEAADGAGALAVYGFRLQMAGGYNGELPFWIHANRFGELSPRSANTTLHLFGAFPRVAA